MENRIRQIAFESLQEERRTEDPGSQNRDPGHPAAPLIGYLTAPTSQETTRSVPVKLEVGVLLLLTFRGQIADPAEQ